MQKKKVCKSTYNYVKCITIHLYFAQFQSGEGARYVTRRAALNKLQLSLKDFRTLCIIKGIYPREPAHRRRAQRGKSGIHILYLKKDILFLLHEPMIWKLRDLQVSSVYEIYILHIFNNFICRCT